MQEGAWAGAHLGKGAEGLGLDPEMGELLKERQAED